MKNDKWSLKGKLVDVGEVGKYPYGKYPLKTIEILRKKLIEDDIGEYENPFIAEEYFNPTYAYEKLEHFRTFIIEQINKRFGVEE